MGNEGQGSRHDHLTATTPEGKIELTEEELSRVAAGGAVATDPGMKVKYTTATRDKVETYIQFIP